MDIVPETIRAIIPNTSKSTFYILKINIPGLITSAFLNRMNIFDGILFIPLFINLLDSSLINAFTPAKQMTTCGCTQKHIKRGRIASGLYYIGNVLFVYLFSFIPVIGIALYWILYPLLLGFIIIEYFMNDMCTKHKYEFFRRHQKQLWLIGGVCLLAIEVLCFSFKINGIFFKSCLSQIIINQVIQNGNFQFVEENKLFNFFDLSRSATSHCIKSVTPILIERIQNPPEINLFLKYKWLLGSSFKDMKSFLQRDVCMFILSKNEKMLIDNLNLGISLLDQSMLMWALDVFNGVAPDWMVSEQTKIVINLLKKKGIKEKLIMLKDTILDVLHETSAILYQEPIVIEDHFRAMSRSPSLEFSENGEYMTLVYNKM